MEEIQQTKGNCCMTEEQIQRWEYNQRIAFNKGQLSIYRIKLLRDNGFDFNSQIKNWLTFEESKQYIHNLKLKNIKEWNILKKSKKLPNNIPRSPKNVYGDRWTGYSDWLGTGTIASQNIVYLTFKEAKKFVQSLKLNTQKEWIDWWRNNKPSNIPQQPWNTYKNEWVSLQDWLGVSKFEKYNAVDFKTAKKFAITLKVNNMVEWRKLYDEGKIPYNIPKCPEHFYKNNGWKGWRNFLGNEFLSFNQLKSFVKKKKFKSKRHYQKWWKENQPKGITICPDTFYDEWTNWYDFLGKEK